MTWMSRRAFAFGALASLAAPALVLPGTAHAQPFQGARRLSLFNPHTLERWTGIYARDGRYLPSAISDLNAFARDWREEVTGPIDPRAWDTVWAIRDALDPSEPTSILSGWRTPATNSALDGTASGSLHMRGQALDLGQDGKTLDDLHRAAVALSPGGVGLYTRQQFVHIDTGERRHWGA